MLKDPDEPRLARLMPLKEAGTADKPLELLPALPPPVTDTPRLCIDTAEPRLHTDESDTHRDASLPVRPVRPAAVTDH